MRDLKPQPNRELYLAVLRKMGPQARLQKAFELSEQAKELFRRGLRERHADLDEAVFHQLFLERWASCHNSNY